MGEKWAPATVTSGHLLGIYPKHHSQPLPERAAGCSSKKAPGPKARWMVRRAGGRGNASNPGAWSKPLFFHEEADAGGNPGQTKSSSRSPCQALCLPRLEPWVSHGSAPLSSPNPTNQQVPLSRSPGLICCSVRGNPKGLVALTGRSPPRFSRNRFFLSSCQGD